MELDKSYDVQRITNGFIRVYDETAKTYGVAKATGCLGSLSTESETRTVVKRCEGEVVEERVITTALLVTFTGHMPIGVLRDVYGFSNDWLKPGVYAIGNKSKPKKGIYTWQAEDLYDEQKKFMAFPNMRVTSGYAFSHENGAEEIAEVTISFKAMKDELGNFYYEAYEKELTDESVKTGWAQTFDQSLVELVTP
jgi:hypothetical protein